MTYARYTTWLQNAQMLTLHTDCRLWNGSGLGRRYLLHLKGRKDSIEMDSTWGKNEVWHSTKSFYLILSKYKALEYKRYSSASDVWSFGCVMYEIWSMGEKLYINHSNYNVSRYLECMFSISPFKKQILNVIEGGYRIPPPPGCPRSIYKIMIECWWVKI